MEFWSVTLVGLAAGLVLVIGGALVIYMGSLVKSAYQLKIEIKSDVDEGLRRLEEEVEKKIRWVKRDLVEEVDKVKTAMQTDNQRKIAEVLDGFIKRLTACEAALLNERSETTNAFESLRNDVTVLDQSLRFVCGEQKAAQPTAAAGGEENAQPASVDALQILTDQELPPPPSPGAGPTASGETA